VTFDVTPDVTPDVLFIALQRIYFCLKERGRIEIAQYDL